MNTQSLVNWTYALHDQQGYSLDRSMNLGSSWTQILSCSNAITTYTDNDLTWYDAPWYRVSAINAYGSGPHSLTAKLFINSPGIDTPKLTGSQEPDHVLLANLSWSYTGSVQGATDYFILEKSFDSGSTWPSAILIDPTGSFYADDNVSFTNTFWYRVRSHCDFGLYGPNSNIVAVLILDWPPVPMPDLITALQSPAYTPTSSIAWSYTGSAAESQGFVLEIAWRGSPDQPFTFSNYVTFSGLGTTTYTDTAVTWSREFAYKMYAYSGSDPSIRRSTETPATVSFMQAMPPQLYAWQTALTPQAVAFWGSYLGQYTMSLSRSSDGGSTWDIQTFVSPTSGAYYYIDDAVSVGNTYQYQVAEVYYPNQPSSNVASVTILPSDPSIVRLGVLGDPGVQSGQVYFEYHTMSAIMNNVVARRDMHISKWILVGDDGYVSNTFRGGYDGQWGRNYGPSQSAWAAIGTHDIGDMGGAGQNWVNYFGHASSFFTVSESNVQVFFLNTTSDTDNKLSQSAAQYNWFSNSLVTSRARPDITWRITVVHAPPYTARGSHAGNPYLQAIPWHDWGIDAVFSGHNHWAERLETSSSVPFFVNGLMGNYKRQIGASSDEQKWFYFNVVDQPDAYVWNFLEFVSGSNQYAFSMSFYSGSAKLPDTGSTDIVNGMMTGYSLVLMKPWFGPPTMSSVTQIGDTQQLAVSWSFTGDFTQSLFRSTDGGVTWPVTTSIDPGVFNYLDTMVAYNQTYTYKVRQIRWPTEPYSDMMSQYVWPPVPAPNLLYAVQP